MHEVKSKILSRLKLVDYRANMNKRTSEANKAYYALIELPLDEVANDKSVVEVKDDIAVVVLRLTPSVVKQCTANSHKNFDDFCELEDVDVSQLLSSEEIDEIWGSRLDIQAAIIEKERNASNVFKTQVEASLKEKDSVISSLRSEITRFEKGMEKYHEALKENETSISTLNTRITELEEANSSLQSEKSKLSKELAEEKAKKKKRFLFF